MVIAGRLDHLAIAADNTEAMVAWYGRVLGLVVHVEAGPNPPQKQKVYLIGPPPPKLSAGPSNPIHAGMMIEVMPRNETVRHARGSHDPGISHAAWYVGDFDAALAHLRGNGVRFLSDVITAVGGGRIISFEDCEGNMMQIVERK